LELEEAVSFISSIESEYKIQKSVLAVLPLGSDVFIINTLIFKSKVENITMYDPYDLNTSVSVVDVTSGGYSLCSREAVAHYLGAIGRTCTVAYDDRTGVQLQLSGEFEAVVGPVLLAGTCLLMYFLYSNSVF
jgi:hypothetical protein